MYFRIKQVNGERYLQLVNSKRSKNGPRQEVKASLGSVSKLLETGQLKNMIRTLNTLDPDSHEYNEPETPRLSDFSFGDKNREIIRNVSAECGINHWLEEVSDAIICSDEIYDIIGNFVFKQWDQVPLGNEILSIATRVSDHWCSNDQPSNLGSLSEFLVSTMERNAISELSVAFHDVTLGTKGFSEIRLVTVANRSGELIVAEILPRALPLKNAARTVLSNMRRALDTRQVTLHFEAARGSAKMMEELAQFDLPYIALLRRPFDSIYGTSSEILDIFELTPPKNSIIRNSKARYIKAISENGSFHDSRRRNLLIAHLESSSRIGIDTNFNHRQFEMRRQQIENWDGVTLLVTNLSDSPRSIFDRYANGFIGSPDILKEYQDLSMNIIKGDLSGSEAVKVLNAWLFLLPAICKVRNEIARSVAPEERGLIPWPNMHELLNAEYRADGDCIDHEGIRIKIQKLINGNRNSTNRI